MPVAAFIPAIISAGAGVTGAILSNNANNNATEAQSDAADKAVALTEKMYQQDRADYEPYRTLGSFAVGELGNRVGMPENFGTQAVADAVGGALERTPTGPLPTQQPTNLGDRARQALEQQRAQRYSMPEFQSLRDLGAVQQNASSFVRMKAPTGEVEEVDPRHVAMFEAQGATRVS
jgi:hypothetical protein